MPPHANQRRAGGCPSSRGPGWVRDGVRAPRVCPHSRPPAWQQAWAAPPRSLLRSAPSCRAPCSRGLATAGHFLLGGALGILNSQRSVFVCSCLAGGHTGGRGGTGENSGNLLGLRGRRSREQPRAGGRRSLVIRWLLLDFPSESLLQREQQEAGPPGSHTETDMEPSQGPLLSQSRWGPGSSTPRPVAPERTLTRRRERLWPSGGAQPPEPRCPRLCSRNGGVSPACRRRRGQSGDWGQPQPGPRSVGASQSCGGSFWGTPSSVHR